MTDRTDTAVEARSDIKGSRSLWSWLCAVLTPGRTAEQARSDLAATPSFALPARTSAAVPDVCLTGTNASRPKTGTLLYFPIHGEALLVKLADVLRKRIVGREFERDPLLLTMSRCPGSRLSIDSATYIDFLADRSAYHVVVQAAPDATIALDTTDFDVVVEFVVQYVTDRTSAPVVLEAAS